MQSAVIRPIFAPSSIAVIGGGNDPSKPGGRVVMNLKRHGFPVLWVVNPKGGEVQGLPTFTSVDALPKAPDLAIICIPATGVLQAARQLIARGTRALMVMSAGFSEMGAGGKALEKELLKVANDAGACLVGPNSMGIFTPSYFGVFAGPDVKAEPGTVDFVSASGSTAAFIMEAGLERGMRFASLASLGNSAQLGVEDFVAMIDQRFEEAPSKVAALYLESVGKPALLLESARSLHAKGCRLVALKAGTTEAGMRAASSHTGAMANPDSAVSALFDKAGIIRAASKAQMVDLTGLLSWSRPPISDDIVVVTHAGGPGIMACDELTRAGFRVPELPADVQKELLAKLYPGSSGKNPIDFLAAGTADHLRHIFATLAARPVGSVGAVCVIYGGSGLFDGWPALEAILEAARTMPFPVYPVLPSPRTAAAEMARFREAGGFYFPDEVTMAQALGQIRRTPPPAPSASSPVPGFDGATIARIIGEAKAAGQRQLPAAATEKVLEAAGFALPRERVVTTVDEAVRTADELGWPVVVKVVGPLHKSDLGGVALGLRSREDVERAGSRMLSIPGATGLLVQQQVSGIELIVGGTRSGAFGSLVMLGQGGIYAEALRDISMALTPVTPGEAERMVSRLRAAPILRGLRGQTGVDTGAIVEAILRMSALLDAAPAIAEIDINPLIGRGHELTAVDGRILVDVGTEPRA